MCKYSSLYFTSHHIADKKEEYFSAINNTALGKIFVLKFALYKE